MNLHLYTFSVPMTFATRVKARVVFVVCGDLPSPSSPLPSHVDAEDKSVVCRVVLGTVRLHGGGRVAGVDARGEGVDGDDPDHVEGLVNGEN